MGCHGMQWDLSSLCASNLPPLCASNLPQTCQHSGYAELATISCSRLSRSSSRALKEPCSCSCKTGIARIAHVHSFAIFFPVKKWSKFIEAADVLLIPPELLSACGSLLGHLFRDGQSRGRPGCIALAYFSASKNGWLQFTVYMVYACSPGVCIQFSKLIKVDLQCHRQRCEAEVVAPQAVFPYALSAGRRQKVKNFKIFKILCIRGNLVRAQVSISN